MTTKPKIKVLYVGYMDCLEGWSKVGITSESFEVRWKSHNRLFPAPARMRKHLQLWLREADARQVEKKVKSSWSDTAEWVKMPHEKLETIIEGEISKLKLQFWRREPKNLTAPASSAPAAEKPRPKPQATPSGLTPPKKEPGESTNDYRTRIRKWRTSQGLCNVCGKAKIDPPLKKRCKPCNKKITDMQKRWAAAKKASASCLLVVGLAGAQRAEACEEAGLLREAEGAVVQAAYESRNETLPVKPPAWLV